MQHFLLVIILANLWTGGVSIASAADCTFDGEPSGDADVSFELVTSDLTDPVGFAALSQRHAFVLNQPGQVVEVDLQSGTKRVVLDIRDRVDASRNEMGLLGIALHPGFAANGRVFFNYTRSDGGRRTRISEFRWNGSLIDPSSERMLLEFPQPYSNHNGGDIAFGPDGKLYIANGDGGSGGDPRGHGQNLSTLLGAILRIDVDGTSPYAIPGDNPFIGVEGARPEIYAYGLRNPWRISFDVISGRLWTGDVGQDRMEEINVIEKGGNYGWNPVEGNRCYVRNCDMESYAEPVHVYPHSQGVSITGGYVYRGTEIPGLVGRYVYGDYVSGRIWALKGDDGSDVDVQLLVDSDFAISSFGEGKDGELYLLDHERGRLYRFKENSERIADEFPLKLSETGCFDQLTPFIPKADFVPYDVTAPLWSDGTEKARFIKLPRGTTVAYSSSSAWGFPEGTVLLKHFAMGSGAVETRFLVRKADGFRGYGYRWLDDGSDGVFIGEATTKMLDDGSGGRFEYYFPSQSDCSRCHNNSVDEVLGFGLLQLNRMGIKDHHIRELAGRGVFALEDLPSEFDTLPRYVDPHDQNQDIGARARSWLGVQCSSCHNDDNAANQSEFDLRFALSLAETNLCSANVRHGDLGVAGAQIVAPGSPAQSLILLRSRSLGEERMPGIASNRIDIQGTGLIEEWISRLVCD